MSSPDELRARMVDGLVASGRVRSAAVEAALRAVPRHLFLPDHPPEEAYADTAVPVQQVDGTTTSSASQPSMVAIMLEQLDLAPGQRVLEIGAGTGWNAALLAHLVGSGVTSVDIDAGLVAAAAARVPGVRFLCADGAFGHATGAPYDRIVLTVGSDDVRPEWVAQLAPGGRLLLPLALRGSQLSTALDLGADGLLRSASVVNCGFVRMRGAAAVEPETTPTTLAALFDAPGPVRPAGVPVGPRDVWDGFGLWLSLADPTAVRTADGPVGFPARSERAAVALVGPGPGAALLAPTDPDDGGPGPRAAAVHAFGPDGGAPATRMLTALAAWDAAGRPGASELRLVVALRPHPVSAGPGTALVPIPSGAVLATWTV